MSDPGPGMKPLQPPAGLMADEPGFGTLFPEAMDRSSGKPLDIVVGAV